MPIYEFFSPDTNRIYAFHARSIAYAGRTPRCPDGAKYRMQKLISSFAVLGGGKTKQPSETVTGAPTGADDPRMDAAMQTMEREFGNMDTENPDPRQLGRMMRRMSELTGEKMPSEMEEMTRRLEAGESPEKLEEELGDQFGEPGSEDMTAKPDEGSEENGKKASFRSLRRRAAPTRDPKLYDMAEYVG
ncbi:MAG: hypothetical protein FJ395_11355 [Verrucomicrobia bacterium]|nr:hypothetical protein [Verrucomicrobiota bacterium]